MTYKSFLFSLYLALSFFITLKYRFNPAPSRNEIRNMGFFEDPAMPKVKLNEKMIEQFEPAPPGKRVHYYDRDLPSLYVQVTDKGSKAFYIRVYRGSKDSKVKIGSCDSLRLRDARTIAIDRLREHQSGVDLNAEKRAKMAVEKTFREYFNLYIASRKKLSEETVNDYKRRLNENLSSIADKPINEITRSALLDLHQSETFKSPSRANGAIRVFRAVYNFALAYTAKDDGTRILPPNPATVINETKSWNRDKRKDRIIHPDDLPNWLNAVLNLDGKRNHSHKLARCFFLGLMLTGWRKNQLSRLKWSAVNLTRGVAVVRDEDTKGKQGSVVPFSTQFIRELKAIKSLSIRSEFVFPDPRDPEKPIADWRHWNRKIAEVSGVEFTPHDLRRSFLTYGSEVLDLNLLTVKRLAQHRTQEKDVTAGYIIPLEDRLRRATQSISDFVLSNAPSKSNF